MQGCRHKHTKTNPDKQGQCGHCCSERDCYFSEQGGRKQPSQPYPELSSRPQLLPHMHPWCWIQRGCSTGPNSAAQTHITECLFYICLSSVHWNHAWHSGNQLDISYWLQLDMNHFPDERYCGDSPWKSNDRTAFSWDGEALCMTRKDDLGEFWELKLCFCPWGLTQSLSDVLQQPARKQLTCLSNQVMLIYVITDTQGYPLVRVNTSLLAGSR